MMFKIPPKLPERKCSRLGTDLHTVFWDKFLITHLLFKAQPVVALCAKLELNYGHHVFVSKTKQNKNKQS